MKKLITSVLILYIVLFLFYFGQRETDFTANSGQPGSISKITLDGIHVQDTMGFQYKDQKIGSVKWCTQMHDSCVNGYSERRYYNKSNELDSIKGRWDVTYLYENGLRKKMFTYLDNQLYSITAFTEYSGTNPVRIKVTSSTSEVQYLDLTYNSSGDLTRKLLKDGQGVLLEDTQIHYSAFENPVQRLIETPLYVVSYFGFDHFAFYYSKHLPEQVTTTRTNSIFPNVETIDYTFQQDTSGKLITARAFRDQNNVHNIAISYIR